jgi:hypothetical protein
MEPARDWVGRLATNRRRSSPSSSKNELDKMAPRPHHGVKRKPEEEAEKDLTKQNVPVLVGFRAAYVFEGLSRDLRPRFYALAVMCDAPQAPGHRSHIHRSISQSERPVSTVEVALSGQSRQYIGSKRQRYPRRLSLHQSRASRIS